MNTNFKPLGIAAAVAAVTAGYAGAVNAASVASETELGDLAIVPYYTTLEGYSTGVNIINTSAVTQVLKFRFRRAGDKPFRPVDDVGLQRRSVPQRYVHWFHRRRRR